jgi:hypothetical protein
MKRYLFCAAIITVIFGCNSEKKESYTDIDYKKEISDTTIATDTTVVAKIIKTADMRFRVKDVQNTKEKLSSTIKAQGGTIAEFSIQSSITQSDKVKYTADSLKEIISYQTEGFLTAKIPSEKLDDFTNSVAQMAVFVDNQAMKMDDQSITYLANKLKAQNRVDAIIQLNKSATKKSNNVETSLYIKEDYVDKKTENLSIDNNVKYSTITLSFYQDNSIKTFVIANDDLYAYKAGFFNRLGFNLVTGWSFVKEIILALSTLWFVFIIAAVVFYSVRYYTRRNKLAVVEATDNLINNNQK